MKTWSIAAAMLSALAWGGVTASAQTIYEPVRYQYGQTDKYYYGGTDPRVHQLAEWNASGARFYDVHSREDDVRFVASRTTWAVSRLPRVYSDLLPQVNAAWFGYGVSDARNTAYANAPRHFTKRQLKQNAVVVAGVRVVPGNGPLAPEVNDASSAPTSATTSATPEPTIRPIMVIPRQPLPKPAAAAKLVASAR